MRHANDLKFDLAWVSRDWKNLNLNFCRLSNGLFLNLGATCSETIDHSNSNTVRLRLLPQRTGGSDSDSSESSFRRPRIANGPLFQWHSSDPPSRLLASYPASAVRVYPGPISFQVQVLVVSSANWGRIIGYYWLLLAIIASQ